MKCYKLLFTSDGLKFNLGNYIILAIIMCIIIITILFKMKGFKKIEISVNEMIEKKNQEKNQFSEDNNNNINKINDQKNKRNIKIIELNENLSSSKNDLL